MRLLSVLGQRALDERLENMDNKPFCNIMLAFVSLVQQRNIDNPIQYSDICGAPYTAIQTNESAIIATQRELGNSPLDKIFLVSSEKVDTFDAPKTEEYGIVTHINFLKKRLIQADSRLADKIVNLRYYDDLDNIDESMRNVTYIAGKIMEYTQQHPDKQVRLFADMTGGFRYNSVMMLAIMQLLQYNGIELGKVLYSDPEKKKVFNATSLRDLFGLISGADEFVKFGSVEGLLEYFSHVEKTDELDRLLLSMQRFSDAIKMCRTGIIKDELKTLNITLQEFADNHGGGLEEDLFASFVATLQKEYGILLRGEATEFDIIRWCERKGFLQQAMTLCTEWLPAYLVNNRIAYTDDPKIILECEQEGRKTGRSWQQYFLTVYSKGSNESENTATRPMSLADLIKASIVSATSDNKALVNIDVSKYPCLAAFFKEIRNGDYDFILVKSRKMTPKTFENQYPMLGKVFHAIYDMNCRNKNFKRTFSDYLQSTTLDKTFNSLATFSAIEIYKLFEIPESEYISESKADGSKPEIMMDTEEKWKKHTDRYSVLYKNGLLKSNLRYNDMLSCLKDYFLIRVERNQINHANTDDVMTVEEVRALILTPMDHWTKVVGDSK